MASPESFSCADCPELSRLKKRLSSIENVRQGCMEVTNMFLESNELAEETNDLEIIEKTTQAKEQWQISGEKLFTELDGAEAFLLATQEQMEVSCLDKGPHISEDGTFQCGSTIKNNNPETAA